MEKDWGDGGAHGKKAAYTKKNMCVKGGGGRVEGGETSGTPDWRMQFSIRSHLRGHIMKGCAQHLLPNYMSCILISVFSSNHMGLNQRVAEIQGSI